MLKASSKYRKTWTAPAAWLRHEIRVINIDGGAAKSPVCCVAVVSSSGMWPGYGAALSGQQAHYVSTLAGIFFCFLHLHLQGFWALYLLHESYYGH